MAGEEHRIRNSNRWENPERSKWAATRCGKDDRSLRASRTIAHCPKPEECNDSGGPAWRASNLGRQYCRTARDGAVTQITVIDAISHFEISERDLLSGVNEQESRMSTAQSGKTKSFRSLGSLSMLSSLPQPVIRDLDSKLILAKHSAGSVLYRQGELAEGIFFLFAGRVKTSALAIDAKTALLKIAGPGEVLGLAAVLSGRPHLTSAQATEPSSVGLLRREDLARSMRKYSQIADAIAQHLSTEYVEIATETLLLRTPCSSSQRLAIALLRLADADSSSRQLALTYTHAELGQLIGASRETVTRLMKRFERRGFIATKKSSFRITDHRLLKQIAELS